MRKLKKFVLNDNRVLSNEELASIEGSFNIYGPDSCTPETKGETCILSSSYDRDHTTITFGVCDVEEIKVGSNWIKIGVCR